MQKNVRVNFVQNATGVWGWGDSTGGAGWGMSSVCVVFAIHKYSRSNSSSNWTMILFQKLRWTRRTLYLNARFVRREINLQDIIVAFSVGKKYMPSNHVHSRIQMAKRLVVSATLARTNCSWAVYLLIIT